MRRAGNKADGTDGPDDCTRGRHLGAIAVYAAACRKSAMLATTAERPCDPVGSAYASGRVAAWNYNWTADPFTRGAYSFATAGFENAPQEFARPIARTIFFAGEATADRLELGTVHGALASGERAAQGILSSLGKKGRISELPVNSSAGFQPASCKGRCRQDARATMADRHRQLTDAPGKK